MQSHHLEIGAAADAVPQGRHFAASLLAGQVDADVVDAAELVVTELLTNALLHGAPPVRLTVQVDAGAARLEVHDGSRALPVRHRGSLDGMTGRGLALIDAVAQGWGVEPAPGGKCVWATVSADSVVVEEPSEVDLDALLAGFDDDLAPDEVARVEVMLAGVPTELLLAAEEHVDSVVRELALAAAGAESGVSAAVPTSLSSLVHQMVTEFAQARQALRRQALAAAARGEQQTDVVLLLPPQIADAGERYLEALEAADAHGRSSRLLTLAAPPQHAVFRRWYVGRVVATLRAAAAGVPTPELPTFEQHLLEVVDHLAELRAVSDRAARLQGVTALLARALDRDEVTRIILREAVAELGADRGLVVLATTAGLRAAAHVGYDRAQIDALVAAWHAGQQSPSQEARATGRPVWVESAHERDQRFPALAALEPAATAVCAVPLAAAGSASPTAVLRLAFEEARLFGDDERAFLTALAAVASQALERADLYDAQSTLAGRLGQLQSVSSALARTRTVDEVLDATILHATGLLGASVASVSLLREDGRTIDLVRVEPPAEDDSGRAFDLEDDLPAAEAIRTGELTWAATVAERDARWPALATFARQRNHALVTVPLLTEKAAVGALTLSFEAETLDEPPREFFGAFADACAQALQRVRSTAAAEQAHRRLGFLARASEELAGALDIDTTLGNVARLTVPEVADGCVVHLLQDDRLACVAVEHLDPVKRQVLVDAQQRWPSTLDNPGVGLVVRTGEALLIPSLADAMAAAAPETDLERRATIAGLGMQSLVIAPLTARGRTLGAISLVSAESGRAYGPGDISFVEDLARRVGVAVDNARLYAVAAGTGAGEDLPHGVLVQRPRPESLPAHADDAVLRWHLAQEAGRLGSWELDVETSRLTWDEQCAELFGIAPGEFAGAVDGFTRRTHPDDLDRVLLALEAVIADDVPMDVEYRVVLPDARHRHLLARARGIRDASGEIARVIGALVDVTELREAASAESRAARVLAGMGAAALQLSSAETVDDLVRISIERGLVLLGADSAVVSVRDDDRGVVSVSVSESLGARAQLEFAELPLTSPLGGPYVARTGETVLLPTVASGLAFSPENARVYEITGRRAWAVLPLRAGDRLLGSLAVGWTEEREFPPQDEELLAAFAAQCAQALDRINSLAAERRAAESARRLSETLQRSLLTRPPQPDHLEVAVRYAPASQEAQVGGDWYDAFFTRDGALSVVIGDCTGHDREAVAAMAAVRNLLRATAFAVDDGPAGVLTALEETMAGLDVTALATAVLARIEQTRDEREQGRRSLVWSSAGHLPPLLLRADGTAVVLRSQPDLMLGLLPSTDRADHRVPLLPDDTILLYTDGLVERRGEDIDAGIERLRSALDLAVGQPLDALCDGLLEALGGDAEDDVALVAVRCHPEDRPRPAEAGPARVPDSRPLDR